MKKIFIKKSAKIIVSLLSLVFVFSSVSVSNVFASTVATTNPATNITSSDATLNGTNADTAATNHLFWVSLTEDPQHDSADFPDGIYSTPNLGALTANQFFSALLSSATLKNSNTQPFAVTPNTTYYFSVWTENDGNWSQGQVLSFTTGSSTPVSNPTPTTNPATDITATDATLNGTNSDTAATEHLFWVSLTEDPQHDSADFPDGIYSTPNLGALTANQSFSALLSSATLKNSNTQPFAVTPNTTYYFSVWTENNGTWSQGEVLNFTTASSSPTVTQFTLAYTANANGSITGSSTQTVDQGSNGTAVTAVPDAGFHFTSWSDATTTNPRTDLNVQGNISASASFEADVVVPPATSTLTIIKHVINDNDGTSTSSDFEISISGAASSTFAGSEQGQSFFDVFGSYNVTEGSHEGYTVTYSVDCAGTLSANDNKICTITNDDILVTPPTPPTVATSTLTIIKTVINDNGGTATSSDFVLSLFNGSATTTFNGSATGTVFSYNATTTYSISENATSTYSFVLSADCSGPLYPGQNKVCTVTNDDVLQIPEQTGGIRIIKDVVGSDGITDVSDNHTFNVTLDGTSTKSLSESENAVYSDLAAGTYNILELTDSGYDLVSILPDNSSEIVGAQITVVNGTTTIVTITNKQHVATTTPPDSDDGEDDDNDNGDNNGGGDDNNGGNNNNNGGNNQENGGGRTGGGNVISAPSASAGVQSQVLGAATDNGSACKVFLTGYMRYGKKNDSNQVRKLQELLNTQNLGVTLNVNGIFDRETDKAVRLFQVKYGNEILGPWVSAHKLSSTKSGTGYVYKTTLRWINHLSCPLALIPPVSL